jgi:hypothetical protein
MEQLGVEILTGEELERDPVLSLEEMRSLGVLQEANRRFFHPLGLALAYTITDLGEGLSIIDMRKEGIRFADSVLSAEKWDAFHRLSTEQYNKRFEQLGYVIQAIPAE